MLCQLTTPAATQAAAAVPLAAMPVLQRTDLEIAACAFR
jgi:hypothetical protein